MGTETRANQAGVDPETSFCLGFLASERKRREKKKGLGLSVENWNGTRSCAKKSTDEAEWQMEDSTKGDPVLG
jgi:hypothetical protein